MADEKGTYFVGMLLESEDGDEDILFPVSFSTKDYKEVLKLTRCISSGDPRKLVMFAEIDEDF
jgi:hypothetical protein